MNADFPHLPDLERQVEAMAEAASPSHVFRLLHEACGWTVPRAAIFLLRKGEVCGWNATGHDAERSAALRAFRSPLDRSWLDGSGRPDFGQPAPEEHRLLSLQIKDKPIGFILAERSAGDERWFPEALRVLLTLARLRLEFDLALRRLAASAPAAEPLDSSGLPKAPPVETAAPGPDPAEIATTPDSVPETSEVAVALEQDQPEIVAARRYARLVATDIRLYNEEDVMLGQRNGDLVTRLSDQLGLGKQTFLRRHGDLGPTGIELLHDAYVQVLAAGDAELIPTGALD